MNKTTSQRNFGGRLASLLFPGKQVMDMSICIPLDSPPEVHATFILDETLDDAIVHEFHKYEFELIPIED